MVDREDDRILYDDSVDEIEVARRGAVPVGLAVIALVAGIVYLSWTAPDSGSSDDARHEMSGPLAVPKMGFDASSTHFKACDGTRHARPDVSIVVAGAAAYGQQVLARVVQFVVVDSYHDPRHRRDVDAQSLCTLSRSLIDAA